MCYPTFSHDLTINFFETFKLINIFYQLKFWIKTQIKYTTLLSNIVRFTKHFNITDHLYVYVLIFGYRPVLAITA